MNKAEKKIYARERALIRRHFKGLKPRPIKIVKSMKHLGEADEAFLKLQQEWLAERHADTELNKLLSHELIHYQLKDEGRFSGHGREFRRRASLLGCEKIAGGCSNADYSYYGDEEIKSEIATTPPKSMVSKSFVQVEQELDDEYRRLLELCQEMRFQLRERVITKINTLHILWRVYTSALKSGAKEVVEERIERVGKAKKGPPLDAIIKEYKQLSKKVALLREGTPTHLKLKKAAEIETRMFALSELAEKYYGGQL